MNEEKRSRRDFIQNITIALLSVLTVLLFTQTQLYSFGKTLSGEYFGLFSGPDTPSGSAVQAQEFRLSAPVRVAVTDTNGRYGSVTTTTADESFESLRALLEQGLGSARAFTPCREINFLSALRNTSVYYDFITPLPLPILADLAWTSTEETDLYVRRLVLAAQGGGINLYLWDGREQYYSCETTLSTDDLSGTIIQYELGNAQFAFDSIDPLHSALDPFSLFMEEPPVLPVLASGIPQLQTDPLLSAMQFNPNTQNRYPDSSGTEVIIDSGRVLRIYTNGTITYRSGGNAALTIETAGDTPTLLEAVTGAGELLNELFAPYSNAAGLCLQDVRQSGDTTTLLFGYQAGGVPIRFSSGEHAAEVILSGSAVSSMTLRIRQYTAAEQTSLLLPLRQTLAIAATRPGRELSVGYADNGSGTVSAQWLAD